MKEKDIKFIDEQVENFRKELIRKLEIQDQNFKKIWNLKKGDKYYHLGFDSEIIETTFVNNDTDRELRDLNNMFLTEDDAKAELGRRKVEAIMKKYSKPFEYSEDNYYIVMNMLLNKIDVFFQKWYKTQIYYFKSEYVAKKVIEEVGEDNLIKYWL